MQVGYVKATDYEMRKDDFMKKRVWRYSIVFCIVLSLITCNMSITTVHAGNTANELVAVAKRELGNDYSKYTQYVGSIGGRYDYAWCAAFVSWCGNQAGVSCIGKTASCKSQYDYMLSHGAKRVDTPQAGDVVFFYCNSCHGVQYQWCHIGIMINSTTSIDGNYGNMVAEDRSYRHWGSSNVKHYTGKIYVRPNYGQASSILPGTIDSSWSVPANVTASHKIITYDQWGNAESNHYIDPGDSCYVAEVYTNGFVKVQYPVSGGTRWAYAKAADFLLSKKTVAKPSYSNFWLSQKDTSYTEYALGDNIEVNVDGSNYDQLWMGIDKDGVGRVLTKQISSHYVFSSKELGAGSYSIYVTVANSNGYVDTNKLWFKILTKPTYSTFWLSKKDASYALGDNIEVNVGASNYDHLYVGIDKDGVGRVITREINSHYVFSSKELGVGNYSIYVTVSNSVGYVDTNKLRFKIYEKEVAHKYGSWTTVKKATCTIGGTEQRKCSICGNIETRTINATGHKYVNKVVEPTTTQKGYTLHTCSVCGYNYKDNYTNVKKQLQWITITAKPSKTTYYINDSIDTTGLKVVAAYTDGSKSEVVGWKVSGNTAKAGKTTIQVSYTEGAITKTASYEILVKESDHSYGAWTVVKKATCTADGTEQRTCNVCGGVESRTVNATGHKYVNQVIAPTATEKGYTLYTCSVCGYSYKDNYTDVSKQLQFLVLKAAPSKTTYFVDEKIDTTGLKVTAIYTDKTISEVENYQISGSTAQAGKTTVEVRYTEGGITKTVSFEIEVVEKNVPKETVYITYDTNGGSMSQTRQSGMVGDTVQILNERPVKNVNVVFQSNGGYSNPDPVILQQNFMRWVDTSATGGTGYYPGDSLQLTKDCTLRAQYEMARLLTLPNVQRDGYTFDGWYTANNVRAQWGMIVTEDTVLTAHWTQQASQPDDEVLTVGDEFVTDQAIYTITKINGGFCVEYSEMYDDDVEDTYIPDTIEINGVAYKVTSIGANAFYRNQSLKKIVIGNYVEKIDARAFYGCSALKDIVINSTNIRSGQIGANAFKRVNKNVKVYVPWTNYKAYKKMLKKAGIGAKAKIYIMTNL